MKHLSVTKQLKVPVGRAYAYLAEHENLSAAFPGLKVERKSDGDDGSRNGAGSRRQLSVAGLLPFEETIDEVVENKLIKYHISKGSPLKNHSGEIHFDADGDGCTVTWNIQFESIIPLSTGPTAKLLQTIVGKAMTNAEQHG